MFLLDFHRSIANRRGQQRLRHDRPHLHNVLHVANNRVQHDALRPQVRSGQRAQREEHRTATRRLGHICRLASFFHQTMFINT